MHSDTNAWKDVAVAYMRVVANFPDSAQAPKALLSAADIEQHQLSDAQAAKSLYQEIVTRFPNDLAAATARQQLQTPAK
jgi:TolA-binding protein